MGADDDWNLDGEEGGRERERWLINSNKTTQAACLESINESIRFFHVCGREFKFFGMRIFFFDVSVL